MAYAQENLFFLVTGGASFILFVFFSYLVHKDVFTQFDFDTTVRLQDMISRRFDELFRISVQLVALNRWLLRLLL